MLEETAFEELVENVADALAQRETDTRQKYMTLVGEVAVLAGVAYIGTRLVQNVIYRRRLNHIYKKTNRITVER